jgi:hypothetical protein
MKLQVSEHEKENMKSRKESVEKKMESLAKLLDSERKTRFELEEKVRQNSRVPNQS